MNIVLTLDSSPSFLKLIYSNLKTRSKQNQKQTDTMTERKTYTKMMTYLRLLSVAAVLFATSGIAKAELDFNDTTSYSFTITNPCTGEDLLLEGKLHILQTTVEKNDGTIQLKQHGNFRGSAVGMVTGNTYRYNNNFHFLINDDTGLKFFQSANIHTRLIGEGDTPNIRVVYSYQTETDVDGITITATVEDVICQDD